MKWVGRFRAAAAALPVVVAAPLVSAAVSEEVEALTGAPTRIVWSLADPGSRDYVGEWGGFQLMGLDTRDGKGVRMIRAERTSYSRPLISPDGGTIVFTDRTKGMVQTVGWDGKTVKDFAHGFAASVWRDPRDGVQWVYLRPGKGGEGAGIERRRLDNPEVREHVYGTTPVGHPGMPWFRLSADGTLAADAFPWPKCGLIDVAIEKSWTVHNGCWPSMSPDNSYRFFVFHGNHREVTMYDARAENPRVIATNTAPGVDGRDMYFPHWSNHPRFMTVTGPGVGGDQAELYLGRFGPAFNKVERWVKVTDNNQGDFFGDAWIAQPFEPDPGARVVGVPKSVSDSRAAAASPDATAAGPAAPPPAAGARDEPVFFWLAGQSDLRVPGPGGQGEISTSLVAHGRGRLGPHGELVTGGGAFHVEQPALEELVLEAAKAAGALTLEAVVASEQAGQRGPARIVTFSGGAVSRNLTLGQEGDQFVLRVRTPQTGPNATVPEVRFGEVVPGTFQHVAATYTPGDLRVYVDGEPAAVPAGVEGGFENWAPQHIVVGDEWGGGRNWRGAVERVRVFARALSPDEVAAAAREAAQARAGWEPVPRSKVRARVVEAAAVPAADSIAPYLRVLAENVYDVEATLDGPEVPAGRVLVAEWVIMDRAQLPGLPVEGEVREVALEPRSAHPQLASEKSVSATTDFSLPQFYAPGSAER